MCVFSILLKAEDLPALATHRICWCFIWSHVALFVSRCGRVPWRRSGHIWEFHCRLKCFQHEKGKGMDIFQTFAFIIDKITVNLIT
ncbi:hypothetical protein KP509_31G049000 [Ceratopteris richardii]|uniref:Uncharacterized protein n=1 Tax=Ceratopteris richardii TaxID=49495 RepID=A0A8T2QZU0_CERRI|nr:hypothetical protein KP509_31G049000 [Ceratopteris richardii]